MSGPAPYPGGVAEYITAQAQVTVALPKKRPACQYCVAWCRYERDFDRYTCRITGEPLFEITKNIGLLCPVRKGINDERQSADL